MENDTKTMTAWTPSFDMSTLGRPCAHSRVIGFGVVTVLGAVANVAIKGDFPGLHAWSPPTS